MEVIHDWDDDQAAAILSAVHNAATPGTTVLIIEAVADEEVLEPVVRTLDVIMLAITGGRERTSAELEHLLASVGLHVTGTLPTPSPAHRRGRRRLDLEQRYF